MQRRSEVRTESGSDRVPTLNFFGMHEGFFQRGRVEPHRKIAQVFSKDRYYISVTAHVRLTPWKPSKYRIEGEETMSTYEEIISAALALPPDTRAMLAEHLLESLDAEDQKKIDALWAEEAERRNKEIDDGVVTPIPGEEVMNRLRARYR